MTHSMHCLISQSYDSGDTEVFCLYCGEVTQRAPLDPGHTARIRAEWMTRYRRGEVPFIAVPTCNPPEDT